MNLVLASNGQEATLLARQRGWRTGEYLYLTRLDQLQGTYRATVWRTACWTERATYHDVELQVPHDVHKILGRHVEPGTLVVVRVPHYPISEAVAAYRELFELTVHEIPCP